MHKSLSRCGSIVLVGSIALGLTAPVALTAQDATSREVVQPLPSRDVQRLNRALLQLAKRPNNVGALVEAAEASLKVNDLDAALGFYRKADELSPNNAKVKLGMANTFLRSGRPVEALPLFDAALSAGADAGPVHAEKALALDLVGDNEAAQTGYKRALVVQPDNLEAKRRLALSYAISGNSTGFEETLRPLLDGRDFAAFRTRAFGLAIMGEQDRAAAIVDAVMPRDLAGRITPYLAFMPRLTKSQQAAAANLGIFPRAADIGRDSPAIIAYAGGVPASSAPVARTADSRLAPSGAPLGAVAEGAPEADRTGVTATPEPGFDLARSTADRSDASGTTSTETAARTVAPANVADAFADLDTGAMPGGSAGGDAVDLAAIDIPREAPPQTEPKEPDHPSRIWVQLATGRDVSALKFDWRRFSRKAPGLLSDFKPHVTPWGQANRLLAGPVESRSAARDLINALKEQGIDTFRFTSPEGTEIKELK